MSMRRLLATTERVLIQLGNDKRSLALIMWVPIMLELILRYIYSSDGAEFNLIGAPMLGIFPLVMMFVVASVATLRERTKGTLDRLMVTPLTKAEFVLGYALAFSIIAVAQAVLVSAITIWLLGLAVAGSKGLLIFIAILNGVLGMALGLLSSAYAKTEFHVVQFMPALIMPQFLLCGLLVPRQHMNEILHWLSDILPLSYAVEAIQAVARQATVAGTNFWRDIVIVALFAVGFLILGSVSIRRKTA